MSINLFVAIVMAVITAAAVLIITVQFYGRREVKGEWYLDEFESLPEDDKRHFAEILKKNGKVTNIDIDRHKIMKRDNVLAIKAKKAEIIKTASQDTRLS